MSENEKIDTSNIFEDFNDDASLKEELDSIELEVNKDLIYYLSLAWNIFKYINFALFMVIIVFFSYLFIQKSDWNNFYQKAFLNPFCGILLWDAQNFDEAYCSWVSSLIERYELKLSQEKKDSLKLLIPVLKDVYTINNFINSEKVSFVIDKTNSKTNPVDILSKFDKLKNNFLFLDKKQISCQNIVIKDNTLDADCSAFTSYWDSSIPWYNWEKWTANMIWWTSVSFASSFINYIEKSEDSAFELIDKQKVFTAEKLSWETWYIYRTDFKIRLYYKEANLSL